MQYTDRRIGLGVVATLLLAFPSGAVPAVLTALSDTAAQWQVREPVDWAAHQTIAIQPEGWPLVVTGQSHSILKTRLTDSTTAAHLRLGEVRELTVADVAATPVAAPSPLATHVGTVVGLIGEQVLIQANPRPNVERPVSLEGHPETVLHWVGPHGRNWLAASPVALSLGTRVVYEPGEPVVVDPVQPQPTRTPDTIGEGNLVTADDPIYGRFAALAAARCVPGTTQRHFRSDAGTLYTRGQLADFLAAMVGQLMDAQHIWPIQSCSASLAVHLQSLLAEFEPELLVRHVDVAAARASLAKTHPLEGFAGLATGEATARLQSGDDAVFGQLEGSYHGLFGDRLRFDVAGLAKSAEPFPDEFDRDNLVTLYGAYDLSRHATVGLGRRATRFGPGQYDLLWGGRTQPLDQLSFDYHTKVFGRPFRLTQQTGTFSQGGEKYVTVRRYEYGPADHLTLGLNFGLITNEAGQALASMVLPLYATRFTNGNAAAGGNGNFLGSFDASWQLSREWQVYGQFFADDFDFSPTPPATAQRIGLLGGVYYTPRTTLPGTSYRLEATIIPDRGTYVGQQNVGLAWLRDGYLFGHPYGQDAAGIRFDARHRITPRWDVSLRGEYFRQLRSFAISPEQMRFDLATYYDLNYWLSVGLGVRYSDQTDMGGVAGNDRSDTALFIESRAGL